MLQAVASWKLPDCEAEGREIYENSKIMHLTNGVEVLFFSFQIKGYLCAFIHNYNDRLPLISFTIIFLVCL